MYLALTTFRCSHGRAIILDWYVTRRDRSGAEASVLDLEAVSSNALVGSQSPATTSRLSEVRKVYISPDTRDSLW